MGKTILTGKQEEIQSAELKASIKRGLKQIAKGEVTPHEDVMKRVKERHAKKATIKTALLLIQIL